MRAWCSASRPPGVSLPSTGARKTMKLTEQRDAAELPPSANTRGPPRLSRGWLRGITGTVLILGVISLFTDMSSEMIVPLRLIFLTQTLGAPFAVAGLIEGVAESATSLLKIVSGQLADRFPNRRGLVIGGYTVSYLNKPLLALVTRWPVALGAILVDRPGKARRG